MDIVIPLKNTWPINPITVSVLLSVTRWRLSQRSQSQYDTMSLHSSGQTDFGTHNNYDSLSLRYSWDQSWALAVLGAVFRYYRKWNFLPNTEHHRFFINTKIQIPKVGREVCVFRYFEKNSEDLCKHFEGICKTFNHLKAFHSIFEGP